MYNYFCFNLFADDSNITKSFPRSSLNTVHLGINNELIELSDWLRANKIKLNVNKTKYLIFSYRIIFELGCISFDNNNLFSEFYKCYLLSFHSMICFSFKAYLGYPSRCFMFPESQCIPFNFSISL